MEDISVKHMPSIIILVVLYKCPPSESETIISVLKQSIYESNIKLIIWDNSPEPMSTHEFNNLRKNIPFEYISTIENTSLSKLYNEVVQKNSFEYILLLDQDSGIPENYFEELMKHIALFPQINLFLPIVKNKNQIVSPGEFQFFKGKHWKFQRTGLISSKNLLAVTSGMLISNKYFKFHNYKFDERLNLYGIDFRFMLQYAQNEDSVCIIPLVFEHNSALWSDSSAEILLPRFKNVKRASRIIFSDKPVAKFFNTLHSTYSSVKLAVKYRDIRFLF